MEPAVESGHKSSLPNLVKYAMSRCKTSAPAHLEEALDALIERKMALPERIVGTSETWITDAEHGGLVPPIRVADAVQR